MYTKEQYFYIQEAIKFLYKSLEKVEDRSKPELVHSLHVGFRLMNYGYSSDIVIAGFLHDVLEEGDYIGEVKKLFGAKILDLVKANTKDESLNTWQEKYEELIPRVIAHSQEAMIIKAVDILDNFLYFLEVPNDLSKKKTHLLVDLFLKNLDSNEPPILELRRLCDKQYG